MGGEEGALLHLPDALRAVVNGHFATRYGSDAAPTAAESLHILRHAANGLCGEPAKPLRVRVRVRLGVRVRVRVRVRVGDNIWSGCWLG